MAEETLRYDRLVESALRDVVREALRQTAEHGLPGDHHFYLTFRTHATGVDIPDHLREQYPDEMTIVLQHQFWDLRVEDVGFAITLSFGNRPAPLYIPFAAMTSFVDPSVKFALQFNAEGGAAGVPALRPEDQPLPVADNGAGPGTAPPADEAADEAVKNGAEVVNLDQFRKK